MQVVRSGDSYLSQSDKRLHFGLGTARLADHIEVRWPDGQTTNLENVAADQILQVRQLEAD
jgi:hypothetical protein